MQELTLKIKKILSTKFPDYTESEIEEMIADYGEIGILETMKKTFSLLKSEDDRNHIGELMSEGKTKEAVEYADSKGVDMISIFEEVAKSVVMDLFS